MQANKTKLKRKGKSWRPNEWNAWGQWKETHLRKKKYQEKKYSKKDGK